MVVDAATKLVEAENGRFRFVDYTEKKLVPGAVRGALADKREMAVRDIGECIVGQAALHRSSIFVNDVTKNNYFIQFKSKAPPFASSTLRAGALRRRGINPAFDQRDIQPLWKPRSRGLHPLEPRPPFIPAPSGGVFWRVFINMERPRPSPSSLTGWGVLSI